MSQVQIVRKIAHYNFKIFWTDVKDSELLLNFKPIIDTFKLKNNFILLHWQAKPKYLRRWGLYYSVKDMYYPFDYYQLKFEEEKSNIRMLQINEAKWNTKPSAVILVQNVSLQITNNNELIIK